MNKQSTALDRNFAEELSVFQQYDDDYEKGLDIGQSSTLIKHIVFFAAYKYQKSPLTLFNSFTFDVDEFCAVTGYKKTHLLSQHPQPYQLRLLSRKKRNNYERIGDTDLSRDDLTQFTNVIENALYRLATTPPVIHDSYKYVDTDGSIKSHSFVEGVPIIKHLAITGVKSRNGKVRKVYQMELSEMMCNNFSRMFTPVDYRRVIEFRKQQLDDFYVFLKAVSGKLAVIGKNSTTEYNFSKLCEAACINYAQPNKSKAKLIEKVDAITASTELNVHINWSSGKGDNRVQYVPTLVFDETDVVISTVSRVMLLYKNFIKFLFENLPHPSQFRTVDNKYPFLDENQIDKALITLLRTYPADQIVEENLKMTFQEAVERAYVKSQVVTFGPNNDKIVSKGRVNIFKCLRERVKTTEDIEHWLAYNYDTRSL